MSGWTLVAALGLMAPAGKDAPQADGIVGEWVIQSLTKGGETASFPQGPDDRVVIRFARDGTVAWPDRDGKDRGEPNQRYTLDGSARPARIGWTTAPPRGTGKIALGIYKIEDGLLTLAVAAPGADRPEAFSTSKLDSIQVFVLKRLEKKKD